MKNSLPFPMAIFLLIASLLAACTSPVVPAPDCMSHFSVNLFFSLANERRIAEEMDPLQRDSFLSTQASAWADYNGKQAKVAHYDEDQRGPLDRLRKAGFKKRLVSENITVLPRVVSEGDVLKAWHGTKEEENLLNPLYGNVGFGLAPFKDGCVFVVLLTE